MNPVARGVRNAFRNSVRTGSIVLILGLSIGLSLVMLVAQKAVDNKIKSVKSSIGNTISVSPAGFTPGSSANNALDTTQLNGLKSISHVTGVTETLNDHLPTTGSSLPEFGKFGSTDNSNTSTTSLKSPVTVQTTPNGASASDGNSHIFFSGGGVGTLPTDFSLPISFLGTTDPLHVNNVAITIKSGKAIDASKDTNNALISQNMASKNNLQVGSTFTAYNTTLTVAGIFSTNSNDTADNTVVLALPTLQRLSSQSGVVTSATVTVDSLDNLSSATTAVKNKLGSSADVVSAEDQADNTVAPLNSVKTVSTFSLIGATIAGAVIILLTMVMVVRERKREIGVVKAIGGSNLRIIGEFMIESLTLTILGAVIGLIIGVVGGQPVTKMLVSNSTNSSTNSQVQGPGGRMMGPGGGFRRFSQNSAVKGLNNINAQIGWGILLDGFGAAVFIAVVGSALAAGMISRVRPSTVMRTE